MVSSLKDIATHELHLSSNLLHYFVLMCLLQELNGYTSRVYVQKQKKKDDEQIEHLQLELASQTSLVQAYKQKSKERKAQVSKSTFK